MWFGPNFLNQQITFADPNSSTWALEEQVSENADEATQDECEALETIPEVRGVFICSKISGNGPKEAIIKVIMQIPWKGTYMQSSEKRKLQSGTSESIDIESTGLKILTEAKCSCTPWLLGSKVVKQSGNMWVPGGYLGFVAMTRLPGITISRIDHLAKQEAEKLRQSFKKAWIECYDAGVSPVDTGVRNLLWDAKRNKCYIVDFGQWVPAVDFGPWRPSLWWSWNLKDRGR